jgi:hypothetical protein
MYLPCLHHGSLRLQSTSTPIAFCSFRHGPHLCLKVIKLPLSTFTTILVIFIFIAIAIAMLLFMSLSLFIIIIIVVVAIIIVAEDFISIGTKYAKLVYKRRLFIIVPYTAYTMDWTQTRMPIWSVVRAAGM